MHSTARAKGNRITNSADSTEGKSLQVALHKALLASSAHSLDRVHLLDLDRPHQAVRHHNDRILRDLKVQALRSRGKKNPRAVRATIQKRALKNRLASASKRNSQIGTIKKSNLAYPSEERKITDDKDERWKHIHDFHRFYFRQAQPEYEENKVTDQ